MGMFMNMSVLMLVASLVKCVRFLLVVWSSVLR